MTKMRGRTITPVMRKIVSVMSRHPGTNFTRGQIAQMIEDLNPTIKQRTVDRDLTAMSSKNEMGRYFTELRKYKVGPLVVFSWEPKGSSLIEFME